MVISLGGATRGEVQDDAECERFAHHPLRPRDLNQRPGSSPEQRASGPMRATTHVAD